MMKTTWVRVQWSRVDGWIAGMAARWAGWLVFPTIHSRRVILIYEFNTGRLR